MNLNVWDVDLIPGFHALFSSDVIKGKEPYLKLSAKDLALTNAIIEEIEKRRDAERRRAG